MNIQIDEQTHKKILIGENGETLSVECETIYPSRWAKTAAYLNCMLDCTPDPSTAKVGDILSIEVDRCVSCEEGGELSLTIDMDKFYSNGYITCDGFITTKVLDITEKNDCSAVLKVRVVARGDRLSFVKPVSDEEKQRLRESREYDYIPHELNVHQCYLSNNMFILEDELGGGDIICTDYVYIDDDGIDHLVQKCYSSFEDQEAFFGDKVLGYHEYNTVFEKPRKLSDGTVSPEIPKDFMRCLRLSVSEKGAIPFMQNLLKYGHARVCHPQYHPTIAIMDSSMVLTVEVDAFLYAMKIIIEESEEFKDISKYKEAMELCNELVGETFRSGDSALMG